MQISLIVAAARNGVIGRDGAMPWHLPADLGHFKALTLGHHLLVGRRTWEAIGRPLPGRTMLVLSRRGGPDPAGTRLVSTPEAAVAVAREAGENELFVAGGGEVYRLFLPLADRVYLTRVEAEPDGDVRFSPLDPAAWRCIESVPRPADERNALALCFEVYERSADGGGSLSQPEPRPRS